MNTHIFSKTRFILIVLLLIISTASIAQQWSTVGQAGFSPGEAFSQSIAFDGEIPYVAFIDRKNDDKVTVMKFDGSNWIFVGDVGFTPGDVDDLSFALNGSTPYVAFSDNANSSKLSVMKFDGSNWINVGAAGFTSSGVSAVSLKISNGIPYVAFQDWASSKASVMKLDGGTWSYVGSPGFSTGWMTNVIDLAVDGSTPYIVYRDYDASYKASVMKYDEVSGWELVGAQGFSGGTHDANECISMYNGIPYVTSWDANANATTYKFNGTDWVDLGTPVAADDQSSSQSICFSTNGTLYMAYSDWNNSQKATVFKYEEESWQQVGEAASLGNATNISIAISNNGTPYIAFRDGWNMRRTTVMKFDYTTSLNNQRLVTDFNIYPNPSNGIFMLNINNYEAEDLEVRIINQLGQTVFLDKSKLISKNEIDLSKEPNGLYILQLKTKQGTRSKSLLINR